MGRTLTVPIELAGERLDRAIARLAPEITRGEARRLIAAGVVFVEGRRTKIASHALRAGDGIRWERPAEVRDAGVEPRILVERPELWIIDKPAGMPVEPTRTGSEGTLVAWLKRTRARPFVTHRLDAATSGVIVVAREPAAQAELNRLFAAHAIGRRYLAVVSPAPPWEHETLRAPLDGRPAVTHADVLARSPGPPGLAALLSLRLETGRTRQIRRHLAAAGFPVIGETPSGHRQRQRLLLHALDLTLPWPGPNDRLTAAAPPPEDFVAAALALGLVVPT